MLVTVVALAPAFAAPPEASAIELAMHTQAVDPPAEVWARALRQLRGQSDAAPTAGDIARARSALDRGLLAAPTDGTLRVDREALVELRQTWGRTRIWADRVPMASSPDGPVVLATDAGLPLRIGDVVLAVAGQPVSDLHELDRAPPYQNLRVRRGTEEMDLPASLTVPLPPDRDIRAPTCGPCCHGHCGDDLPPIAVPVPVDE